MYMIEPHLHTTHVSRCGRLEAQEIVAGYKAAGYSAVTDHFNRTTFDYLGLDPAGKGDRVGAFLEGYRRVREEGERQGLRVFKGAELRFDECENDYLLYGWADELLAEPEEIFRMGIAAFSPIARGLSSRLHPGHCPVPGRSGDLQRQSPARQPRCAGCPLCEGVRSDRHRRVRLPPERGYCPGGHWHRAPSQRLHGDDASAPVPQLPPAEKRGGF